MTRRTGANVSEFLAAVDELRPTIAAGRDSAEANRRLDDGVFAAMERAGLTAMPLPQALGGSEMHPVDLLRVWEAVARIDPAAAWNLLMTSGAANVAAFLPQVAVDRIFREGPTTVAGSFNPPASARKVDGGWVLSGQYSFASGIHHAKWTMCAAIHQEQGEPVVDPDTGQPVTFGAILPRADVTIVDTWHTLGMRGTGSADVALNEVFVPQDMTFNPAPLTNPVPALSGPTPRLFPLLLVMGESIVSVAVAAQAVEMLIELAEKKVANFTATTLRDRELIQFLAGKALSRVNASRAYLHQACAAGFEEVSATQVSLSTNAKIEIQLASTFAAEACVEAVRAVHDAVGTSGIRIEAGFERLLRDALTLTQHASKQLSRYSTVGRLLFGLPNDWIFLSF